MRSIFELTPATLAPTTKRRDGKTLFDDFFSMSPFRDEGLFHSDNATFMPSVDLEEQDDKWVLRVDVPGVPKDQLKIEVDGDMLTLSGSREESSEKTEGTITHRERRLGSFTRSVQLPDGANTEKIEAEYKNGVLTLSVPREEAKSTKRLVSIR